MAGRWVQRWAITKTPRFGEEILYYCVRCVEVGSDLLKTLQALELGGSWSLRELFKSSLIGFSRILEISRFLDHWSIPKVAGSFRRLGID